MNRNSFKKFKDEIKNFLYTELDENFIEDKLNNYIVYKLVAPNDYHIIYLTIKGSTINIYSDFHGWTILPHKDQLTNKLRNMIDDYYHICYRKYQKTL